MRFVAAKGLGDALYLRAVVLHVLGRSVTVFTDWPEVFSDLPVVVRPRAAASGPDLRHVAYSLSSPIDVGSDKFVMSCRKAGITDPVALRLGWRVRNTALVKRVRRAAGARRILVYQPPRKTACEAEEVVSPRREAFARHVHEADGFRIKVGHPSFVQDGQDMPCELDLVGKTSVTDALDIGAIADAFFGEPCYLLVVGEAMDKPVTCMFSRRALSAPGKLRNYTPERMFHSALSVAVYDEEPCDAVA